MSDMASACTALDALHALGARSVVMTSSEIPEGEGGGGEGGGGSGGEGRAPSAGGFMTLLASCPWEEVADECGEGACGGACAAAGACGGCGLWAGRAAPVPGSHARFCARIPRLPADFTGTGDLTAALLLAHGARAPRSLVAAVRSALSSLASVCADTIAQQGALEARAAAEAEGRAPASWVAAAAAAAREGDDARAPAAEESTPAFLELSLLASRAAIETPPQPPAWLRIEPVLL